MSLTWKSYVSLITVFIALGFVIRPVKLKLPRLFKWLPEYIEIDCATAPFLATLFLLATTCLSDNDIVLGIVGVEGGLRPYAIIILFFSLAYICVSLDYTGIFEYIAFRAVKGGSTPTKLFFIFYSLATAMTIITSNDIVVLTLTPLVCYACRSLKIDPVPHLMAQFIAANSWSTLLYIGNPTNIIVCQAFNISFLQYSAWMTIPTIFGSLVGLAMTWLVCKPSRALPWDEKVDISAEIEAPLPPADEALSHRIRDKFGAIFGSVVLLSCLVFLLVSSVFSIPVWLATLPFALLMFIRDLVYDLYSARNERKKISQSRSDSEEPLTRQSAHQPALLEILRRLPWKVAPFVFCTFILAQNLQSVGWVALCGRLFHNISSLGSFAAIFLIGLISIIAIALCNNQPITILLTQILLFSTAQERSAGELSNASLATLLSVVSASNYGALLTLNGALAGLMWIKILSDNGVHMTYRKFSLLGTQIAGPSFLVFLLVLWAEVAIIG
eukprot:Partr_v1_DN25726_c1_g2_i1_m74578 putative Arsenical pump membrane protein